MAPTFGTVVNPTRRLTEYLATHASNKLAKSLVAIATPNYAAQLASLAQAFPQLQTVAIACDTVPLGCQRSGFSWMLSERGLSVKEFASLQPEHSRNWEQSTSAVRLTSSLSPSFDLAIPAANTLFSTGRSAEIYASGQSSPSGALSPLSALHIELDEKLAPAQAIKPAKPISEWLEITSVTDNMLKLLDGGPAARVLEESAELKETKEPAVFAELDAGEMVRVVAGGGGLWSPRSSMLVLEAPAAPRRGQMLRFWLETDGLTADLESQLANTPADGVIAETAPVPQTTEEERPLLEYKADHHIPVFGFGSELGFFVGDHKHSIVGESLYFRSQ